MRYTPSSLQVRSGPGLVAAIGLATQALRAAESRAVNHS
jgi:hypothetical protein